MTLILPPQESAFAQYWGQLAMDHYQDPSAYAATASKMRSSDDYSPRLETTIRGTPSPSPMAKRRPSRAGTRSVTTLTAAQLERKRANDREAQRAIRQRTKDRIEQLERRIAELTAPRDSHEELLAAIERNKDLERENALLRNRLEHARLEHAVGGFGSRGNGDAASKFTSCVMSLPLCLGKVTRSAE